MRLHVTSFPFAHVRSDVSVCAYTQKVRKFVKMMGARGWDVVLYCGSESEEFEGVENVHVFNEIDQIRWYGKQDKQLLPLIAGSWDSSSEAFITYNARTLVEMSKRYEPGDLIMLTGGWSQKLISDNMDALVCEWAVGYTGWFLDYVCFESQAWRHHCYGAKNIHDGRWFDAVIPNFFDVDEFPVTGDETKEGYLLFTGRMIRRKGPHVAAEIAREMGKTIVFAGPGVAEQSEGLIVCEDGTRLEGDVLYAGVVAPEKRWQLMAAADAMIAPTQYVEPFGGVVVESMLSGTQSVGSDWGAFPEILGSEFTFRTLAHGCAAVERAIAVPPAVTRARAIERFSLEAVAPQFEEWIGQLETLYRKGWYEMPLGVPGD